MVKMYKPNFKGLIDLQLIVPIVFLLVVGVILSVFFTDSVDDFKGKYKKKTYAYTASLMLFFAFIPFLGTTSVISNLLGEFVFYQVIILILGIVHVMVYRTYFKEFGLKDKGPWLEMLFNFIVSLFCLITFMLSYAYFNGVTYLLYMMTGIITFYIPTWVFATYMSSISIPAKLYTTWKFPDAGTVARPKDEDYRDMVVISLVFNKLNNAEKSTEFRAKAPVRMDFGDLFYHFAHDYNDRNPESRIELENEDGDNQSWVFYLKPNWHSTSKYLDPRYPLYMNGIEENSVIYCLRTPEQNENLTNEESVEDFEDIESL